MILPDQFLVPWFGLYTFIVFTDVTQSDSRYQLQPIIIPSVNKLRQRTNNGTLPTSRRDNNSQWLRSESFMDVYRHTYSYEDCWRLPKDYLCGIRKENRIFPLQREIIFCNGCNIYQSVFFLMCSVRKTGFIRHLKITLQWLLSQVLS